MTSELRECPFCGGGAFTKHRDLERTWSVGCSRCQCQMPYVALTEAEAIAAWNTRQYRTPDMDGVEGLLRDGLPMLAFADQMPTRDELRGEQTFLTWSEASGTWDLEMFEAGWGDDMSGVELGNSHWLDISEMWPRRIDAHLSSSKDEQEK